MVNSLKIGVYGANGRVGRLLVELISRHKECILSSVLVRRGIDVKVPEYCIVTSDVGYFLNSVDLVIDFSLPDATSFLLDALLKTPKPLVCGTTGLSESTLQKLKILSEKTQVLYARNMSKGVAILDKLVWIASKNFSDSDVEILEIHHRFKKDAPSGTAIQLGESAAKARGLDLGKVRVTGRDGKDTERSKDEIAIMSLRGGDVAGEHRVGFYALGEYLELTHSATSRLTFAKGAIDAALWLVKQPKKLYSIEDMFDF